MKKIKLLHIIGILIIGLSFSALAYATTTTNWYIYKGFSTKHTYSIKFPTDWQAKTFGDELQGFGPASEEDKVYFLLREFEGKSFDEAINYYTDDTTSVSEIEDIVFASSKGDLLAKKVKYFDSASSSTYTKTFIKRGTLIVSLTNPGAPVPAEFDPIISAIHDSFTFTDNWHQYIDFKEKYTFIFPANLKLVSLNNGVEIQDTISRFGTKFFDIAIYDAELEEAIEQAAGPNDEYVSQKSFNFHDIATSISVIYMSDQDNKKYSRVLVEKNGKTFSLSNVNVETNYPVLNYYNQYIVEMLESFEFFDFEGEYFSYRHFPDVRDNHPNAQAINSLTDDNVISGYPDGTFLPDGEINRAELTKLIVENKEDNIDEDKYSNCFPDVKEEWFAPYVCYALEKGWVEGYSNGYFRPANKINRSEALKIIFEVEMGEEISEDIELLDTTVQDVDLESWYAKYFVYASNFDLLDKQHIRETESGYYYYPAHNISRKEVAESLYRMQK
ncbi:hypothetical protein GF354_00355 [Candidatus Peregrinibacteria bacterium]|nr:hypothetical protein [Candidatus Peregrinibacteria bacterium]